MSLVVSSTTDTQEQVNAAAGIEAPETEATTTEDVAAPPRKSPVSAPKPTQTPDEEEPDDEEPEEEPAEESPGEEPAQEEPAKPPKRTGGFQRKIDKLEQRLEYQTRRSQELEDYLIRTRAGQQAPQQPPQQPAGPPRSEQFDSFEDYINAAMDYRVEQRLRQALEARAAEEQRQRQQQAHEQVLNGWHERVGRIRSEIPDFNSVLDSVSDIKIPPVMEQALLTSEDGPRLAYELARQPELLGQIARLEPLAQVRALGKFEASLAAAAPATQGAPPRRPVSQAPEPIRPVGQGASSNGSSVPLDQMSYADYKRARERQIKARRQG